MCSSAFLLFCTLEEELSAVCLAVFVLFDPFSFHFIHSRMGNLLLVIRIPFFTRLRISHQLCGNLLSFSFTHLRINELCSNQHSFSFTHLRSNQVCFNTNSFLFTHLMGNQLCSIPYFFCFTSNQLCE